MDFAASVRYLTSLGHETLAMKFGLRNTELLFTELGDPETKFRSVQIAGTNGKGSTASFLDAICRAANIRTGLYTSPHLVSITERIKVCGRDVGDENFAAHATRVREIAEGLVNSSQLEARPTFFEQVTAIALSVFSEARIELAILETGLGGRLDSTTAARAQLVGITPIDFDHQQYLGNTLESIAAEKAAIIRPGVLAVIAQQQPEALRVILDRCEECHVTPVYETCVTRIEEESQDGRVKATFETASDNYEHVWLGLRGRHQVENAAVAIQLAEQLRFLDFNISRESIEQGLAAASHPGRLELIGSQPTFLLDGAHNPAGAQTLRDFLQQFRLRPLVLVFGAMQDKELDQFARILFPVADYIVLTCVANPRTASTDQLKKLANTIGSDWEIRIVSSSDEALRLAMEVAGHGMICIAGSLYLVGEVRPKVLQLNAQTV